MTRRYATSDSLPVYPDGILSVYEIKRTTESYSQDYLHNLNLPFYFRELAIYDKTRIQFQLRDLEVTKKLMIPQTNLFEGKRYVVVIGSDQHEVYNATTIVNQDGFRETELTCVRVQVPFAMEVLT